MNKARTIVLLTLIMITGLWAIREIQIYANYKSNFGTGPDVIVGDIPDIRRWGASDGETSFSIATTSCNIGAARLDWISNSNIHPVISQNLYRVKNGRIEQLGMSWLKHGFAVAAGSLCGTCKDFSSVYLAVGCSDPYGAFLNGSQSRLGPRSEVNATTGIFAWGHGSLPQTGTLDGRIRVPTTDLDPAQNGGARYFVESQYIHPQDAAAGNDDNNASFREAFVEPQTGGGWDLEVGAPLTVMQQPAIVAWQTVHPDVRLFIVDIPNDGRYFVGVRTTQPEGAGSGYHTEIAIENLNSHQSARSLGVTFGSNLITNPGFNDVDYQFEPYSGNDWIPLVVGNEMEWATDTFAADPNANALRWNSLYSFWCDSTHPPRRLTLGLFRPGTTDEVTIDISETVVVEGSKYLDGVQTGGLASNVNVSDDQYLEMDPSPTTNPLKQRVDLLVLATSPSASPSDFAFRVEAAMSGGVSGDVIQTIEMLNYDTGDFELIDSRAAEIFDDTVEITPPGDANRFVQASSNEITARITWASESFSGAPFFWSMDIDEAVWVVAD